MACGEPLFGVSIIGGAANSDLFYQMAQKLGKIGLHYILLLLYLRR